MEDCGISSFEQWVVLGILLLCLAATISLFIGNRRLQRKLRQQQGRRQTKTNHCQK